VMGSLVIPSLNLKLPIYHGVSETVLQRGIGHIPSTALPVGGIGTNCVLVGHRGVTGYELFTNLDKLEIGDYFYSSVLGEDFVYCVDDIAVTLPEDISAVRATPGKDYMTLATCTPLGINSHRLLVRGVRVDGLPPESVPASGSDHSRGLSAYEKKMLMALLIAGLIIAVCALIGWRTGKSFKNQKYKKFLKNS